MGASISEQDLEREVAIVLQLSRQRASIVGAAFVGASGTFLPWVTVPLLGSFNGASGGWRGMWGLLLFGGVIAVSLAGARESRLPRVSAVAGVAFAVVAAIAALKSTIDILSIDDSSGVDEVGGWDISSFIRVELGIGLPLMIIAAIAIVGLILWPAAAPRKPSSNLASEQQTPPEPELATHQMEVGAIDEHASPPESAEARRGPRRLAPFAASAVVVLAFAALLVLAFRSDSQILSKVSGTVDVGGNAAVVLSSPTPGKAFVASRQQASSSSYGKITVIDGARGAPEGSVVVGSGVSALAVTPDGNSLYVAEGYGEDSQASSGRLVLVDLARMTVSKTVNLPIAARSVLVSRDGTTVHIVGNHGSAGYLYSFGSDLVIKKPVSPVSLGSRVGHAALAPDGKTLYVASPDDGRVIPVDLASRKLGSIIEVGGSPISVAVSPGGQRLYVTLSLESTVATIDVASGDVASRAGVGANPQLIALSPDGGAAYVTNYDAGTVSVMDTESGKLVATVRVGTKPFGVATDAGGDLAYVAHFSEGTVSILSEE